MHISPPSRVLQQALVSLQIMKLASKIQERLRPFLEARQQPIILRQDLQLWPSRTYLLNVQRLGHQEHLQQRILRLLEQHRIPRTLSRNLCQRRADRAMICQFGTVQCLMQSRRQIATLISSVNPQRPKQTDLVDKHLALPLAKSVVLFTINSNRNTLVLRLKNRCKASKLIEAQANDNHLSSSRTCLYLLHSNSLLLLQTHRMFHTQHIKPVQDLTQGDGQTEILGASIL